MNFDLSTVIVAVIGALATLYGIHEARQGRKETLVQEKAAQRLGADQLQLEEYRALIPDLRSEVDRAYKARDEARTEADKARRLHDEAMALARRLAAEHLSDLNVLRGVVTDEIAREANATAVEMEREEQP